VGGYASDCNVWSPVFDPGLHNLMHIDLHWLDVPERVTYELSVTVYHCLHGTAPKYLSELCTSVADAALPETIAIC